MDLKSVQRTQNLKLAFSRPFLFLLFLLGFILDYSTAHAQPQVSNNSTLFYDHAAQCGTTPAYIRSGSTSSGSGGNGSGNFTSVANFPSYAVIQCGKISLFYEDLINGFPQAGFSDPTYGQQRRNTVCAVLTYIQNLISFSSVSASDPIRLYVENSYSSYQPAPVGTGWFAQGGPFINTGATGLMNGFFNQYVISGTDPIGAGDYHARIRFNFDSVYAQNSTAGNAVNFYNLDTGNVAPCQIDLYTTTLHEMLHGMGWISLLQCAATAPYAPSMTNGQYTGIDNTIYVGTPGLQSKLINNGSLVPFNNPQNNYWINNGNTPDNHPVYSGSATGGVFPLSFISHLDDQPGSYSTRQHISPGDNQDYVMGPFGLSGVMRRKLSKIELQTLVSALGYTLTPTAAASNGVVLNNHTPYSTRTRNYAIPLSGTSTWAECVPHDFPVLQNHIGSSITYYFASDPTIIDPDGDAVYAYPGSIVNFRGCGNSAGTNGGNNHDQIQPITNAAGKIIGFIYTPRHNFMGRAQFGLNLWDGKEKGGFVYYNIDVTKGSNVSAPIGTEMVMNGGYEDGSEVKRIGADEVINNASADMSFSREGRFNLGNHMSDSHPFDWFCMSSEPFGTGIVVNQSNVACGSGQTITYAAGHQLNAIPGTSVFNLPNVGFPLPATNGGQRYQQCQSVSANVFLLADSVYPCGFYTVQYDTYAPSAFGGNTFTVGFVDSVTCSNTSFANLWNFPNNQIHPYKDTIATSFAATWTHHTTDFFYCGTKPSGVMYINTLGYPGYPGQVLLIDNVSLIRMATVPHLTASITQTIVTPCQTVQLTGHADDTACTALYTWIYNGQTVGNTQSINVSVNPGGLYTLIVNDGCRADTATITVTGGNTTASITASSACVPATLTASPSGTGYNYAWSGPAGFNSAANPITANQPGTYTVNISAPNGCVSTATYNVTGGGNACCNAVIASTPGTVSFSNTTASYMLANLPTGYATGTNVTTNNYIVIDGTFTVDTSMSFGSCPHIVFSSASGSPAEIILNSGKSLTIKQSTLRAACGYMWNGITASDPGNTVTISGSELHDMINGVTCINGALLQATTTQFIDNYTSLAFWNTPNNPNLNQPATYGGIIQGNTFTTSINKLLAPYAGQNGKNGVYTNNTRYLTIGGISSQLEGNAFSKLATGIYIDVKQPGGKLLNYVSTTNIQNNSFADITGGAYGNQTGTPASQSIYNDPDGTAVYGKNYGTIPAGNVINVTNGVGSTAQFTNCTKGVTLTGMSANVTNTRYNNLTWGINFGNAAQAKYVVTSNNMQNVYYGVSVNGSPNAMTIARNKYNSPATYFQTFNNAILLYPVGISLSAITNTSGAGTADSIYSDTLNMNALSGIAINLQNTGTEVKTLKNLIYLNPPNSGNGSGNIPNNLEMQGIAISNALGSTIAGNHITGNAWAITTNRTNVAAVAMTSSPQLRLNCNHMNNMRYGFLTVGNCATDTFAVTSNDFGGQTNGMLFRHLGTGGTLGQIGTRKFDNSNTFTPPFASDANGNQMRVYTMSLCNTTNQPPIFTGYLTNVQSGGNNAGCRYQPQPNVLPTTTPNTCSYQGLQRIGKVPDIDAAILIARDQVTYDEYPDVARWLNQSQLFDQLTTDDTARMNNPVLDSFYVAMQTHPIRNVNDLNEKLQYIMNALAQGDADLYDQLLHDAQNANGNIGNSDQMAANERQINNVYIKYSKQGLDSLNTGDSSVIASLALQCPLIGGSAVYKARFMYALIAPVRGYDDIDICNSAGAYKGGKRPFDEENDLLSSQHVQDLAGNGFKVYPNPANETVMVDYTRGGTFTLTDMLGRVIKTVVLGEHAGKITVDIHNLMPGVYTYTHIVDGKPLDFGKLVVTK